MKELSVLIGGKAGDGISQAAEALGRILAGLGYRVYGLVDYPSLIRGGTTSRSCGARPPRRG